jgi:hypothetical protein
MRRVKTTFGERRLNQPISPTKVFLFLKSGNHAGLCAKSCLVPTLHSKQFEPREHVTILTRPMGEIVTFSSLFRGLIVDGTSHWKGFVMDSNAKTLLALAAAALVIVIGWMYLSGGPATAPTPTTTTTQEATPPPAPEAAPAPAPAAEPATPAPAPAAEPATPAPAQQPQQ